MAWRDEWPLGPDGKEYDGKRLMDMVRNNSSPFRASWDVQLLIQEIEVKLHTEVIDIPMVHKGSNNYVSPHFRIHKHISLEALPDPCSGMLRDST